MRSPTSCDLVQAVESGRVKVSVAADIASLSREEQRSILAKVDKREILEAAAEIRGNRAAAKRAQRVAMLITASNATAPLPDRRFPISLPTRLTDMSGNGRSHATLRTITR